MRFNDRELANLSNGESDFDGILNHRTPTSGNFGQSAFKERYFKLKSNLLFYYRLTEINRQPAGVLVLENFNVQYEVSSGIPFAFSITYRDDVERKHLFSGRTDPVVQQWMAVLKQATYGYWRSQLIILQTRISAKSGKDPLLVIPHNQGLVRNIEAGHSPRSAAKYTGAKTTTFRSHLPNMVQSPSQSQPQEQKSQPQEQKSRPQEQKSRPQEQKSQRQEQNLIEF